MSFSGVELVDAALGDVIFPFVKVHAFLPFRYPSYEASVTVGVRINGTQQAPFVAFPFWWLFTFGECSAAGAGHAFICACTE